MTREEFSLMLVEARQSNNISRYKLNQIIHKTDIQTMRIEKASVNYSMDVLFPYLQALNMSIMIYNEDRKFYAKDYKALVLLLKTLRAEHYTQSQFSEMTGLSLSTIYYMEIERTSITIDTLLLMIKTLGLEIKLIKND